jgi:hypothetical protein
MIQKPPVVDPTRLKSYINLFMKEYNLNITNFCKIVGISRTSFYSYMDGYPTWNYKVKKMSENARMHHDKKGHPYIFRSEKIF